MTQDRGSKLKRNTFIFQNCRYRMSQTVEIFRHRPVAAEPLPPNVAVAVLAMGQFDEEPSPPLSCTNARKPASSTAEWIGMSRLLLSVLSFWSGLVYLPAL